MHFFAVLACATLAHAAPTGWSDWAPFVSSEALQALISLDQLVSGEQTLQSIADAAGGNRVFGSKGHNDTVYFVYDTLVATGYYDVELQQFEELYSGGNTSLIIGGEAIENDFFTYDVSGSASASLVAVGNLGCETADFPPEVSGAIAVISRGTCPFAEKAANALTAGAVGAIIYNNVPGAVSGGTFSAPGDYAPSVSIAQDAGEAILAQLQAGPVTADLSVVMIEENRTTFNVIAETKGGDHNNVVALGAHTDSVQKGPGINDDGSGTIGILTVALALAEFTTTNAVRFGFWTAEEFGLLGSTHYVATLNQTAGEIEKVRMFLDFDMLASPNYANFIYDGDGSSFNSTGPPGSGQIEADFMAYYDSIGQNYSAAEFDGRSDYMAFMENGVPCGGLFSGAEDVKTAEEVEMFGGEADVPYDVNYHQKGDNIDNIAWDIFLVNVKSIANSVAKYAQDLSMFPPVTPPQKQKRSWKPLPGRTRGRRAEKAV